MNKRNKIQRMLSALQDPKTRDEAMLDIIKANPDVSKNKLQKYMQNELMEDEKMKKILEINELKEISWWSKRFRFK